MAEDKVVKHILDTEYIVLEDIEFEDMIIPAGTIMVYDSDRDMFTSIAINDTVDDHIEVRESNEYIVSGTLMKDHMDKLQSADDLVNEIKKELKDKDVDEKFDEILGEEPPDEVPEPVVTDEASEERPTEKGEGSAPTEKLYTFDIVQICPDGEQLILQHFEDVPHNGISLVLTIDNPIVLECPKTGEKITLAAIEFSKGEVADEAPVGDENSMKVVE